MNALCEVEEQQKLSDFHPRPILFIDVDGVLFGVYGGHLQLRPYVNSFLSWAQEHFRCFWLTAWNHDQLDILFSEMYFIPQMRYAEWTEQKTEAIERLADDGEFFWLDDDPLEEELEVLMDRGWRSRLVVVNPQGRDSLDDAVRVLCAKSGLALPSYMRESHERM